MTSVLTARAALARPARTSALICASSWLYPAGLVMSGSMVTP
jgi:hypothetical protein